MPGPSLRLSLLAGSAALALFAGCTSSGGSSTYARNVPYPEYAAAGSVQGMELYTLCHQGRSITIVGIAVNPHLRHGDYFGSCGEANRSRHDRHYGREGTARSAAGPSPLEGEPR